MFGRKKQQQVVQAQEDEVFQVQYDRNKVTVTSSSMEFAAAIVELWETQHGAKPDAGKKTPLGFSNDHMSDIESEVGNALPEEEERCGCGCDDDEEED